MNYRDYNKLEASVTIQITNHEDWQHLSLLLLNVNWLVQDLRSKAAMLSCDVMLECKLLGRRDLFTLDSAGMDRRVVTISEQLTRATLLYYINPASLHFRKYSSFLVFWRTLKLRETDLYILLPSHNFYDEEMYISGGRWCQINDLRLLRQWSQSCDQPIMHILIWII